jgi:hypothetical protein
MPCFLQGVACHAAYIWHTDAIPPNNPTSTSGKVEFSNDQWTVNGRYLSGQSKAEVKVSGATKKIDIFDW